LADAARLSGKCVPEEIEAIEALLAQYRRDVVEARIKLASPNITFEQEKWLWQLIDCREWLIKLVSKRYEAEMEKIDRELEQAFRR
jgi:hypothetical protein